jgi:hypothetical protein
VYSLGWPGYSSDSAQLVAEMRRPSGRYCKEKASYVLQTGLAEPDGQHYLGVVAFDGFRS